MFEVKGMLSTGVDSKLSNTLSQRGHFQHCKFSLFLLRLRFGVRYRAIRGENLSPSGHIIQAQHEKCQGLACEKTCHVKLVQTYFNLATSTIAAAYRLFLENGTQTKPDFLGTILMRKATFHYPAV